ncbi:MAG TPA: patatin-like phospholipase family protein [Myxococcaceae bacterium]|nr:patatin-like phospholipase family protein [Myxococcaceae bacterium]
MNLGLVLTGGGARAAYQVGALRALAELFDSGPLPFQVVCGVSAGAINGSSLAAEADDFQGAVKHLADTWLALTPDHVYRTDALSLVSIGSGWFRGLTAGGAQPPRRYNHLLDTAPLRELLGREIEFERIHENIQRGHLRGLAISATNYETGTSVTFFDGAPDLHPWARSRRMGVKTQITLDQVMASASIPIFFPPVQVGRSWYGDGGVRLNAPMSPALHLGADRVLAIGIRHPRTAAETAELNDAAQRDELPLSQILGVLMNAVFLDSLEPDIERVERVTEMLDTIQRPAESHLRPVRILLLQPSQDLAALAADQVMRFPRTLRFLLKGLGVSQKGGADLLSYLAFEQEYIERLVTLGYEDTRARADEVRDFVRGGGGTLSQAG